MEWVCCNTANVEDKVDPGEKENKIDQYVLLS